MGIIFDVDLKTAKKRTFETLRARGLTIKEAKEYKVYTSKTFVPHILRSEQNRHGWKTFEVKKVGEL